MVRYPSKGGLVLRGSRIGGAVPGDRTAASTDYWTSEHDTVHFNAPGESIHNAYCICVLFEAKVLNPLRYLSILAHVIPEYVSETSVIDIVLFDVINSCHQVIPLCEIKQQIDKITVCCFAGEYHYQHSAPDSQSGVIFTTLGRYWLSTMTYLTKLFNTMSWLKAIQVFCTVI